MRAEPIAAGSDAGPHPAHRTGPGVPALEISGVRRAFGTAPVLDGVELSVSTGELVAILGASGGGKTTLLRLVCGFERADAGRISIGGAPVDAPASRGGGRLHVRPEHRGVGYVAQDGALFPHLSVAANVLFGLGRRQRGGAAGLARAEAMLELVGLPSSYAGRSPQFLSGGEQQRVALARALAPQPRLVLLDEPFSALDAGLRVDTRRAVADALRAAGAAALLVTHDQAEALSMGDRVGVLRDGRLVQLDTPSALYRRPVDAALARFVGEAVLLDGQVSAGAVSCALGVLALATDAAAVGDGPVQVMIRPEQLVLADTAPAHATLAHATPAHATPAHATVEAVSYYGHDAGVTVSLPGGERVTARVSGVASLLLRPGAAVGVAVRDPVVAFAVAERHRAPVARVGPAP